MLLPQTEEYALRAMAHIASLPDAQPIRAKDLARAAAVPQHYLSKILRKLVTRGLLTSEKGRGGGFALALPAAHIRFLDILLAVGLDQRPNHCAFGWDKCNAGKTCPLHDAWRSYDDAFWRWATETTLAGLTRR